jgi:DNA-binding NarL/FixJ family response regulator
VKSGGREREAPISRGTPNIGPHSVETPASLQARLADANAQLIQTTRHLEAQKAIAQKALSAMRDLIACSEEVEAVCLRLKEELRTHHATTPRGEAARRLALLTARQRTVMELILAGHPNKIIAAELRISIRTVENHRAVVMKRTGCASLPALVRLAIAAFDEADN